jgi:hypothetical protein
MPGRGRLRLGRFALVAVVVTAGLSLGLQPVQADSGTYTCTVTAGGGAVIDLRSSAGITAGGCRLVTVSTASTASAVNPAEGCNVSADTNGDAVADLPITVGTEIPAHAVVYVFCNAGVFDADNSITLGGPIGSGPPPPPGWAAPVTVAGAGINEPLVTVAPDGTTYFSPTRKLFRSTDDGATWADISPPVTAAPPATSTDTSVSVAPDGTLWWTRFWPFAGPTLACRSTDRGDSWSCNDVAIGGVTDRMWIVGVSAQEAYLQTMEAMVQPVWARTTDGGTTWLPTAAAETHGWNGSLTRDHGTGQVWQVLRTFGSGQPWSTTDGAGEARLLLFRVDGAQGQLVPTETGVPMADAFPAMSAVDGVLWLAGETADSVGSRHPVAARSTDGGTTWTRFALPTSSASVTFTSIAAGARGRVAVAFYGSDRAGDPQRNGGQWDLHVVETSDGGAATPAWTETVVARGIHTGSICAGVACAEQGDDPVARDFGDLLGTWVDDDGLVRVGFVSEAGGGGVKAQYVRQVSLPTDPAPTVTEAPYAAVLVLAGVAVVAVVRRRGFVPAV